MRDGLIDRNPCTVSGASNAPRASAKTTATPQEVARIIELLPERYRVMVLLAAWTGLRSGEIRNLRRRNVDTEEGKVTVTGQVQSLRGLGKVARDVKTTGRRHWRSSACSCASSCASSPWTGSAPRSTCPTSSSSASSRSTVVSSISGLSGDAALSPASGVGSGVKRDPNMVALNEIIARINTLFAGDFEPGTVEEFVRSAAAEVSRDPQVLEEIEAYEIDQFRKSPSVPNKVIDAVLDVPGLMEKMTGEAIGNPAIVAAIAEAAYLLHKIQYTDGE